MGGEQLLTSVDNYENRKPTFICSSSLSVYFDAASLLAMRAAFCGSRYKLVNIIPQCVYLFLAGSVHHHHRSLAPYSLAQSIYDVEGERGVGAGSQSGS